MLFHFFLSCCQTLLSLLVSGGECQLQSLFSLILVSSVAHGAFGTVLHFIKQNSQLVLFTLNNTVGQFLLSSCVYWQFYGTWWVTCLVGVWWVTCSALDGGRTLCSLCKTPEVPHGSTCLLPNFRDQDIRPRGVAWQAWGHTSGCRRISRGPGSWTHPYTMAPGLRKLWRAITLILHNGNTFKVSGDSSSK